MKMMFISFCCSRKGFRLLVQAAKQRAVWLSLDCINGKYLWALPTPTTFEKVDQTFIINWQINLLNHNLLMLSQHLKYNPKIYFNLQDCLSSSSACKNIRRKPAKSNMQLHQIVYCLQNPIITFSITAPKAKKNITP